MVHLGPRRHRSSIPPSPWPIHLSIHSSGPSSLRSPSSYASVAPSSASSCRRILLSLGWCLRGMTAVSPLYFTPLDRLHGRFTSLFTPLSLVLSWMHPRLIAITSSLLNRCSEGTHHRLAAPRICTSPFLTPLLSRRHSSSLCSVLLTEGN
jgi:hypothetical protein